VSNTFSQALPVPAMSTTRVLAFGYDLILAGVRTSVLRHWGYHVEETFSLPEALKRAQSDSIDVILICHSVPDNGIEKLVTAVRKTRALMPILCMRTHPYGFAPRTCVLVENTPIAILNALKVALEGYTPPNQSRLRIET
jgi:CheY-like chemotaxis protein